MGHLKPHTLNNVLFQALLIDSKDNYYSFSHLLRFNDKLSIKNQEESNGALRTIAYPFQITII